MRNGKTFRWEHARHHAFANKFGII